MAKINLTNQQNQENPQILVTLASLGVLLCMVVTLLGIKLWWFKHRLSFEQTSTQNGAAGGSQPMVVVPKRNKPKRFNKDKRWSQQISENVEVHGVFRQKQEDELDIQRPQQLPPVRIRQLSESTQSLILPPPRNKRRQQQVHSTAFEDMEIVTPTFGNSPAISSSVLNNDSDTRLSLTFEEFQKQFKLKEIKTEIKPEVTEIPPTYEVIAQPVPPLRLSRSSSAMEKPEKPQHFLKSSQSITIPEHHHKVIERRPTGFSRPTEDLTKIDDYEEPQIFENFGERRATGYIKYEEVDRDLNDRYEEELNQMKGNTNQELQYDFKFTDNGNWESSKDLEALEALRNERIIYQNDLNESPENFNTKTLSTLYNNDEKFKTTLTVENKQISAEDYEDYELTNHHRPIVYGREENPDEDLNFKPVKDRRPTEFVRNIPEEIPNDLMTHIDSASIHDDFDNQFSNWPQFEEKIETPKVNVRKFENHDFERQTSMDDTEDLVIKKEKSSISFDLPDDNSAQEHFEKSSLNQRRPTGYNRNWVGENIESDDGSEGGNFEQVDLGNTSLKHKTLYNQMRSLMKDETRETSDKPEVRFELSDNENSGNEDYENSTLKQRRGTGYVRKEKEEENFEYENYENFESSALQQRRPTGFERNLIQRVEEDQGTVKFNFTEDQVFEKSSLNQRRPTGYVRRTNKEMEEVEIETQPETKVKFEISNWPENSEENYSLNQRRPTEYIRNPKTIIDSDEEQDIVINEIKPNKATDDLEGFDKWIDNQRRAKEASFNNEMLTKDSSKTQVTFDNSTIDFEEDKEYSNSNLKQRTPTGYIKKLQARDDLEGFDKWIENQRRAKEASTNKEILTKASSKSQVTFDNSTIDFEEDKEYSNSSLKQRRPTGYFTQANELTDEDVEESELKVSFAASTDFKDKDSENSHLAQRRPTGFTKRFGDIHNYYTENHDQEVYKNPSVRFQEMELSNSDDDNQSNSRIKQRRPTGFVRTPDTEKLFESTKEVNFNLKDLADEDPHNQYENEALKARRPTGYVRRSDMENLHDSDTEKLFESSKQVNFNLKDLADEDPHNQYENEALKARRPTGYVRRSDMENFDKFNEVDPLWQEMEKDLDHDFTQNLEEEFAKIRHSYEVNEGDFLELKQTLKVTTIKPTGFGKTIEDDWDNFEKLETPKIQKLQSEEQEIQIIYNDPELATTSILKESRVLIENQEDFNGLPRKSKVTFDFKTEEHIIPARKTDFDSEDDYYEDISDYDNDDDDVYNKPPPPIPPPPQPRQRLSQINYNSQSSVSRDSALYSPIVVQPSTITLFGTQISQEDNVEDDSWSAIRRHRNLTEEFQQISMDSTSTSPPPPSFNTPPPKPAFRNPLAQLAIQRAKEVRQDMAGFKSRSINDANKNHPEASKRNREKLNLHNDDFDDTEA